MLCDHIRGVLNGIARLLVGPGPLEDMGGKDIAHIMRSVRQQAFNRPALGPGVIDPVALYRSAPCLIERVLTVSRIRASHLRRLDEERARVGRLADQTRAMALDSSLDQFVEPPEVWEDQAERLGTEERGIGILEGDRRDQDFPPLVAAAPTQLASLHVLQLTL